MEEKENQSGCRGCIDHNGYSNCCDFIENHRRCRPVPAEPKGCVLKAATWEEQAELEKAHAWDQKKARKLLEKGERVKDVADAVGASICSIGAMLNGKVPPKTPEIPKRKAPALWGNEELPLRPTFQDAAKRKREQAVQPIQEVVKCKRKQKGRNSVEKGTWHWAREEEFLPLYNAKMTDAEIGEKMGLAAKTIGIYRQKMGYPYIANPRYGHRMKNARKKAEGPDADGSNPSEGDGREYQGDPGETQRSGFDGERTEQSRAEQSRAAACGGCEHGK